MEFKKFLTDPNEHNPENFVYLVHGILDGGNGINPYEIERRTERVKDPDQFYRASMVACLDKKTAIEKLSYHDDIHQIATFGNVGIIIDPTDNGLVQIAWNCDLGSPVDPEELRKYVEEHKGKIKNPFGLLTQTLKNPLYNYNELILKGDKETEIKGVFYREGDIESHRKAGLLAGVVHRLYQVEIPVIGLPPNKRPDYDNVNPQDRELAEQCSLLSDQFKINQLLLEFFNPEKAFRSGLDGLMHMSDLSGMNFSLPSMEQIEAVKEKLIGSPSDEEKRTAEEYIKRLLGDNDET